MEQNDVVVVKKGERVMEGSVRRAARGVRITAKVHPSIEELMQTWGTGASDSISAYGRHWSQVDVPLLVYNLSDEYTKPMKMGSEMFSLALPGSPLTGSKGEFNLSFLRLVGLSRGSGITFDVRGVFSPDALEKIRKSLGLGIRQLFIDYLLPVDLNIVISMDEIRR